MTGAAVTDVVPPRAVTDVVSVRAVSAGLPLICPKCHGEMRIISFIGQPEVIIHTKRT
jgi:hypothetical protein